MPFKYCYMNLRIQDLLLMATDFYNEGNFIYGVHSINKVEIFGTVSSVREFDEKTVVTIDDCTGVIACQFFKQHSANTSTQGSQACICANAMPSDKLEEMSKRICETLLADPMDHTLKLGDFVQIRGKLKDFNNLRRIWIHFYKLCDDPNWETFYMKRQLELYKRVYNCSTLQKFHQ